MEEFDSKTGKTGGSSYDIGDPWYEYIDARGVEEPTGPVEFYDAVFPLIKRLFDRYYHPDASSMECARIMAVITALRETITYEEDAALATAMAAAGLPEEELEEYRRLQFMLDVEE